jgi:hypothetical protein
VVQLQGFKVRWSKARVIIPRDCKFVILQYLQYLQYGNTVIQYCSAQILYLCGYQYWPSMEQQQQRQWQRQGSGSGSGSGNAAESAQTSYIPLITTDSRLFCSPAHRFSVRPAEASPARQQCSTRVSECDIILGTGSLAVSKKEIQILPAEFPVRVRRGARGHTVRGSSCHTPTRTRANFNSQTDCRRN